MAGEGRRETDWMSGLPDKLQSVPLWNLAIPGSHDTMSYDLDINSPIIEPDQLIRFSKILCARQIVRRLATTETVTIREQLDAGIRYFDLRIARKPNDSNPTRLYFYHGLCTRTDVETVLKAINDWAEEHPKEILILALSHFKGLDEKIHSHLISFIKTLFGAKLFPRMDSPTLKSCWETGRNIIVSYDYPENQHPELWMKITYFYGNTMDPAEVEATLDKKLATERPSDCFFVCGLNLTLPENRKIVGYIHDTFTKFILRSLPTLLEWVKKQIPGGGNKSVNIIASDLATYDDFVSTVIKLNDKIL